MTQIVPIFEGQVYQKAIIKSTVAGNYLNEKMFEIFSARSNIPSRFPKTRHAPLYRHGQMNFLQDIKHATFKVSDQDLNFLNFNPLVDN